MTAAAIDKDDRTQPAHCRTQSTTHHRPALRRAAEQQQRIPDLCHRVQAPGGRRVPLDRQPLERAGGGVEGDDVVSTAVGVDVDGGADRDRLEAADAPTQRLALRVRRLGLVVVEWGCDWYRYARSTTRRLQPQQQERAPTHEQSQSCFMSRPPPGSSAPITRPHRPPPSSTRRAPRARPWSTPTSWC